MWLPSRPGPQEGLAHSGGRRCQFCKRRGWIIGHCVRDPGSETDNVFFNLEVYVDVGVDRSLYDAGSVSGPRVDL